ncbi:MAG TPA: O-methyltransferase [Longimicrobiales bacterium]|nr:O-methyltransferase [Longimicrobiales bacterium]
MKAPAHPDEAPSGTDPRLHDYVRELFAREDALLGELRETLERGNIPAIQLPVATAKVLHTLVRASGARRVLEVGTLGGYSAIWIARALPSDGLLLTLELEEERAALARSFLERAGLGDRVEVRVGDARELLPALGPGGSFDVVFLDADKESYPGYLDHARRLLRPGGLLLADNALWKGRVLEEGGSDADRGVRRFNRLVAEADDLVGTILTVGDGLLMAVKDEAEVRR